MRCLEATPMEQGRKQEPTGSRRLLSPMLRGRLQATTPTLKGRSARRTRRQHPFEDLHRLPHFVHRPERDAAVRLLERRENPPDPHLERSARLSELACGSLQVDEDAVGVAVRRLLSPTL